MSKGVRSALPRSPPLSKLPYRFPSSILYLPWCWLIDLAFLPPFLRSPPTLRPLDIVSVGLVHLHDGFSPTRSFNLVGCISQRKKEERRRVEEEKRRREGKRFFDSHL
jgi:hypothetical protein